MYYKSTKSKITEEAKFLGNNAASSIENTRFCTNFLFEKLCEISLDPELEPESEREL
jgi:hypothetical protein